MIVSSIKKLAVKKSPCSRKNKILTLKREISDQTQLTEYQVETRDSRLIYLRILKRLVESGKYATTQSTYELLIKEVEYHYPEACEGKHPALTTLAKHWKKWHESHFNDDVIISAKRVVKTRLSKAKTNVLADSFDTRCHQKITRDMAANDETYYSVANQLTRTDAEINVVYSMADSTATQNNKLDSNTLMTHVERKQMFLSSVRFIKCILHSISLRVRSYFGKYLPQRE